jgi:hypothetical protein
MICGCARAQLGDRVVNLGHTLAPLGIWGTVTEVYPSLGNVFVVFDEEFIGGTVVNGLRCGATVQWESLLPISPLPALPAAPPAVLARATSTGNELARKERVMDVSSTPLLGEAAGMSFQLYVCQFACA